MSRVDVSRETETDREVWQFDITFGEIILRRQAIEQRVTKRHKSLINATKSGLARQKRRIRKLV